MKNRKALTKKKIDRIARCRNWRRQSGSHRTVICADSEPSSNQSFHPLARDKLRSPPVDPRQGPEPLYFSSKNHSGWFDGGMERNEMLLQGD